MSRPRDAAAAPNRERATPTVAAPRLPEGADAAVLDPQVRRELAVLPSQLAGTVGAHLVAAAELVDDDPEAALAHGRYARSRAARVAVVREAVGLLAYHAQEWAEALNELRTARRLGGGPGLLAVMADCERGLGRPARAIDLAGAPDARRLSADQSAELRIVVSGARRDLGQLDAAVVALQGPDLDVTRRDPWSARLFYAYADCLSAVGRTDEAVRWFIAAADADAADDTDAAERAEELAAELGAASP
jgi:hypothetical protein